MTRISCGWYLWWDLFVQLRPVDSRKLGLPKTMRFDKEWATERTPLPLRTGSDSCGPLGVWWRAVSSVDTHSDVQTGRRFLEE